MKNKRLHLTDILPGKLYVRQWARCVAGFDLVAFECTPDHGAMRGYVQLYQHGIPVFPNNGGNGYGYHVNVIEENGTLAQMRVSFYKDTEEFVMESKDAILANPDTDRLRAELHKKIDARSLEIEQLNHALALLEYV